MKSRNNLPITRRPNEWSIADPFREVTGLRTSIDRLFDDFLSGFPTGPGQQWATSSEFYPPVNVEETKDHYLMSFDLPGVKKEDVKIELQGDQLVVSGERKQERKEEEKGRHYYECSYGTFQRSFSLPSDVKADQVEADYQDGVLRIAVPKSETKSSKSIQIGEGKTGLLGRLTGKKEKAA